MRAFARGALWVSAWLALVSCGDEPQSASVPDAGPGGGGGATSGSTGSGGSGTGGGSGGSGAASGSSASGGQSTGSSIAEAGTPPTGTSPRIANCPILPANHVFNTAIDTLPVDTNSSAYLVTIGPHAVHLDLGSTVDPTSASYYGIPYNVVHGNAGKWIHASYKSADASLSWDPTRESDCAAGSAGPTVSPCTAAAVPTPMFPIPSSPLVEGGIVTNPTQPYGDHHILLLDADTCHLWEFYHSYPDPCCGWDIFGSAYFDLHSNVLRHDGWTSADAAGFPILPLLLRGDEATSGKIAHALRFTIQSSKIRNDHAWPARHQTGNGTLSPSLPPMGQLFRIKAAYVVPAAFTTQARAIVQALKTYGMYLADGGSDMYISGEPSAAWQDATISQLHSVSSTDFEAVDLSSVTKRAGFDPNSGAVP